MGGERAGPLRCRGPRRPGRQRRRGGQDPDGRHGRDPGASRRRRRGSSGGNGRPGGLGRRRHHRRERHHGRPELGRPDNRQGPQRPVLVLRHRRRLHRRAPGVEDGRRRPRRSRTRHRDLRRRLRGVRLRGDPRHGDRLPDDHGLLAVRHDRRLRQDPRRGRQALDHGPLHLRRDDEPVAQPGADALDQHLDHLDAAGAVDAGDRLAVPGGDHPSGVRHRLADRHPGRHLLVDLRGLVAGGLHEATRGGERGRDPQAGGPVRQRRSRRHSLRQRRGHRLGRHPHPPCARCPALRLFPTFWLFPAFGFFAALRCP